MVTHVSRKITHDLHVMASATSIENMGQKGTSRNFTPRQIPPDYEPRRLQQFSLSYHRNPAVVGNRHDHPLPVMFLLLAEI